ncbi:MAG: hypothetical protein PHX83_03835 [Acidobacteriia bacterium]|nr:hypothetical protein [Terriglobia bacterium]
MKQEMGQSPQEKVWTQINRHLDLMTKLLAITVTDKDFSSHTQEHQIAILGQMGFRNKELASFFGIKPQQVNNAFRKYKIRRP